MSELKSKIIRRTTVIFSTVTLLGFIFSAVVYFTAQQMDASAKKLVDEQLPSLFLIQQLSTEFSEQERILYEYYTTTDSQIYQTNFKDNVNKTLHLIRSLNLSYPTDENLKQTSVHMNTIIELGEQLHGNLSNDGIDWDLAREQLAMVSRQHRLMLSIVDESRKNIRREADKGYNSILTLLENASYTVFIYSLSIVLIAFLVGRYIRNYSVMMAKNRSLALFPERNPNPVFSIDESNQELYCNPATVKLVESQSQGKLSALDLLPENLEEIKEEIINSDKPWKQMEKHYGNRILSIQVHWLNDVRNFIVHVSDITERKAAEEKLQYQAYHSAQTGFYNEYQLSEDLDIRTQQKDSFALGLIEIRGFNTFTTGYGMDAANEMVKTVARRLRGLVKSAKHDIEIYQVTDHIFALVFEDSFSCNYLEELCQSIEQKMEATLKTHAGDFSIELDFGFCRYPNHGDNRNVLMQHARAALNEAASIEHSSFVCYSEELGSKVTRSLKLSRWLKSAVDKNELQLVFQPQLDIKEDRIIGMETLVRWVHDGEMISPADFIPIAEQTGLIVPIGEWILRTACEGAKKLYSEVGEEVIIAINISPRQFRHPDFVSLVENTLKQTGLSPHLLELEITEGVLLYNEADTIEVLHRLKGLGIQLSIDDFGTGYSSLAYLKQFPIDKLKVDQSFVKNLHTDKNDKAIISVIIELGKSLGLKVIAEGVEETAHYDYLKSVRCDEIQGYWYSRPLQHKALIDFYQKKKQEHAQKLSPHSTPVTIEGQAESSF